ncbi:MAG: hypothetical protein LBQ48_02785 [Oscillospiraceae bacterium]|jgi:seryl-tRNA synthetase|nr:hypothetical protein [Oscillospiraceae bacterium]
MSDMSDIFDKDEQISDIVTHKSPSMSEISLMAEDLKEELRKARKKLKRAKKKGKNRKKFKKKIKKLERKCKNLEKPLRDAKRQSAKGRWDGIIERSIPELIKLATVIADRKMPPTKGR